MKLSILTLTLLLLSQSSSTAGSQQTGEKQWQEVPVENQAANGAEYTGADIGSYDQGGGEYSGGDIAAYGNGYSNDYGGRVINNGYSESGTNYNTGSNGYADQVNNNGYGGEQISNNGYTGAQENNNGYVGEQVNNNGYVGEQVNNNGYGENQVSNNGYGGEQGLSGGYGAEQGIGGGYGGDVHTTTSYSSSGDVSGYGDLSGNGFGGIGFGEGVGYGGGLPNGLPNGLSNEGWDKPVKTVVKHIMKNIAVPHPVPAPVHVPVPKYIKYFKPFAIAKPYAVPQVIPVIKHVQKPIPFFTSIPIKHSVPVPKFIGLPVQVRVPRPVFIHVPKIVPVAKKYPVPVTVNIPKPYIVPIYKSVPIPVPHKVPKIINIIKEVPQYVKKPVPVYVDEHTPGFSNGGTSSLSSSSYSNHYGGSGGFDNFDGTGYGNDDLFGGSQGIAQQNDHSFNNIGLDFGKGNAADYGQQEYSNTQNSLIFNNPFIFGKNNMQGLRDIQIVPQNLQLPSVSYPRAHRIPNKLDDKNNLNNMIANYQQQQQQQGMMGYNYSSNPPPSAIELNIEVNSANTAGRGVNYNVGMQKGVIYNQGQTNGYSDVYYQNNNMNNQMSSANSLSPPTLKLPLENINKQFSQPLYNPAAYAEYAMNQQLQQQPQQQTQQQESSVFLHNYSQPYSDQQSSQSEMLPQTIMAEASKSEYYNQHPDNAYSIGYSSNFKNSGVNNFPSTQSFDTYNNQKPSVTEKNNYDNYNNAYNGNNNYANYNQGNKFNPPFSEEATPSFQSNQEFQSSWPNSNYNQNLNANIMTQAQGYNQQQPSAFSQMATKSNNQGLSNYNPNPMSYGNIPDEYKQTTFRNTENKANFNNYFPSGSSSSSSSFSESVSSPMEHRFPISSASNVFMKQNEKFDQSASQNTYTSDRDISIPGVYSPSGTSVSYSNSAYGNSYRNSQNFPQQGTRVVNSESQLNLQSQLGEPSQYTPPTQPNTQNQFNPSLYNLDSGHFTSSSQINAQSQHHGTVQYNSPSQASSPSQSFNKNQFNNINQMNNQNQLSGQTYSNQMSQTQPTFKNNINYPNALPESNSDYVNSGYSTNFSPPSVSSSSFSVSSQTHDKDFNIPAENNYNQQQRSNTPLPYDKQNIKEEILITTTNSSSISKPSFSSSLTYSLTEKKKPERIFMIPNDVNNYNFNTQDNINAEQNKQNVKSSTNNIQYSPQITEADIQNAKSKIDEMEKHIQSSASSIINVYTNSPQSMSNNNGQTFSFMNPEAMGSSQSATFFQPLDSDGNTKIQYSSEDLTVVPAPSYQDPAEPLQTSLDAYVPRSSPYQSSASDQNTVYKEAISETDEYKEAISLNTDSTTIKNS